jgi:hypothetical protein
MRFKGVPEEVVNAIRGGWKDLVHEMGGVDRAEQVCGVSKGQISIYGAKHGDSLPSLCTILAAEIDTGMPLVSTAMANATRHTLIPMNPLAAGELAALLARVGAETGEVFARYGVALANGGQVDAAERQGIARELQDLLRVTHAALAHVQPGPTPLAPSESSAA